MKKVALISLGCAKNLVDSEVMLGYLVKSGYTFVTSTDDADIIIVNTCGFIKPAKDEAQETLANAIKAKHKGKSKKKVIAVGCYVERNQAKLQKAFPDVDVWMGTRDFDKIAYAIEGVPYTSSAQCYLYDHQVPRLVSTPSAWAYVKISEGCSHLCSFCAIPLIKGPYRSRSIASIKKECSNLVSQGVKEINLISQDSTYYGRDRGLANGLAELLRELIDIKKLEWIRVLYGYPEEISDPLLEIMQEDKICSYLDIPFQHADRNILKTMKRGLDGPRALKLIEKIRTKLPNASLRTSLIVGFPGEGDAEFSRLKKFVLRAQFEHLGVFIYSPEEGTECFLLGDPVPDKTKKERLEEIFQIQAEISLDKNSKYLGQTIDVLVEGHLKDQAGLLLSRARFQAPEVDGVVYVKVDRKVSDFVSTIQKVEIVDRDVYDLSGQLLP
jgi:ribosomal protein S12 methylthiotransferase